MLKIKLNNEVIEVNEGTRCLDLIKGDKKRYICRLRWLCKVGRRLEIVSRSRLQRRLPQDTPKHRRVFGRLSHVQ